MDAQNLQGQESLVFSLQFPDRDGAGAVTVISFEGEEGLSRPYRFVIDFACAEQDMDSLVNQEAVFTVAGLKSGRKTVYRGIVSQIEQTGRATGFMLYRAHLTPAVTRLAKDVRSELYLDGKSPLEVVCGIFDDNLLSYDKRVRRKYEPSGFILQYEESLFDFVSRLMERNGIYYFFEEKSDGEVLVIADDKMVHGSAESPGSSGELALEYREAVMGDGDNGESAIRVLNMRRVMLPRRVVMKSFNYRKSSLELIEATATVKEDGVGEVVLADDFFETRDEGDRLAGVRAEELLCRECVFNVEGSAVGLRAGKLFELTGHYRADFNRKYLVVSSRQSGSRSPAHLSGLGINLPDDSRKESYWNWMELIPSSLQFRPARVTPRPRIGATVTAVVDSEGSGQYAEIDKNGEYKVRFPTFGRKRNDGKGSARMRMASPYGGDNHGMHFPLLKGTEVTVAFRDGDPDQPFIAGTIPNSTNKSLVTDENLTVNILKTAGDNTLLMSDDKGKARIELSTADDNRLELNDAASGPGIEMRTASGDHHLKLKDEGEKGEIVMTASTSVPLLPEIPNIQENTSKIRVGAAPSGIELTTNNSLNRVSLVADSSISLGTHSSLAIGMMNSFALGADMGVSGGPHGRKYLWGATEYSGRKLSRFSGQDYFNVSSKCMIGGQEGIVLGGGFLPAMDAPYRALKKAFFVSLATTFVFTAGNVTHGILHASSKAKLSIAGVSLAAALVMTKIQDKYVDAIKAASPDIAYMGALELDRTGAKMSSNPAGGYLNLQATGAVLASDETDLNYYKASKAGLGAMGTKIALKSATAVMVNGEAAVKVASKGTFAVKCNVAAGLKVGGTTLVLTPASFEVKSNAIVKIG